MNFACHFTADGDEVGGLYDALTDCYGARGDALLEELYEELASLVRNNAAVSVALWASTPKGESIYNTWAMMDYTTLMHSQGAEEWSVSEAEALGKVRTQMAVMAKQCQEVIERRQQEELAEKRSCYTEISNAISLQIQIIAQNKGWFGVQAKTRKAAQEQLAILQAQLAHEFPNGRP